MKVVSKIIGLELRMMFLTPVGWLILILFTLQTGNEYAGHISRAISSVLNGGHLINQTTFTIARYDPRFMRESGVFAEVQRYLFLYIPLLTMGAISKELSSGTFKLLQSSPIGKFQIVLGKFGALMLYGLLLMAVTAVGFLIDNYCISGLDYGLLYSGLLGLWLLLCAYVAIGLFISSCCQNQPVAALLTFAVLIVLSYSGTWGQQYAYMRSVSGIVNMAEYSDHLLNGLIRAGDIFYFLLFITLFIFLTVIQLQTTKSKLAWRTPAYIILLLATIFAIIYTSWPRIPYTVDATRNKIHSLTPESRQIARQIHGLLIIHTYANVLGTHLQYAYPAYRKQDLKVFESFQNVIPDIKQDYTLYYDTSDNEFLFKEFPGKTYKQVAVNVADKEGLDFNKLLTPAQAMKTVDYHNEEGRLFRVLEYKGKSIRLRVFDDYEYLEQPREEDIAIALKQLLTAAPKVLFLTGNAERSIDSKADSDIYYATYAAGQRDALRNKGFNVDTVNINNSKIPSGLCALVLADPKMPFSPYALHKIDDYINGGGNLVIMAEADHQNVLTPILTNLGISLAGKIYQTDQQFLPDQIGAKYTAFGLDLDTAFKKFENTFPGISEHIDTAVVSMAGATSINVFANKDFKVVPVLVSDPANSWFTKRITSASISKYIPAHDDMRSPKPLAVAMSRNINGKVQKIIVTGDADWFTQKEIQRREDASANVDFYTGIFNWLSNSEYPVYNYRYDEENRLLIQPKFLFLIQLLYLGIIPGTLLIIGLIKLYKRKIA